MDPCNIPVEMFGEICIIKLVKHRYDDNGRVAILAVDFDTREPFGNLTVNIPEANLEDDEICVKTWGENEYWVSQILEVMPSRFIDTGKRIKTGYTQASVWKMLPYKNGLTIPEIEDGHFIPS